MESGPTQKKIKPTTDLLVERAMQFARDARIHKILVQADSDRNIRRVVKARIDERIAWMTMNADLRIPGDSSADIILHVPESPLSRFSQMRVGMFLALTQGFLVPEESVLCLLGAIGSSRLDTLMVVEPGRDFLWFHKHARLFARLNVPIRAIERVISCAIRLANEGREGRPIGTTFLVGDLNELRGLTHQLILNPLQGHARELRNLHRADFFETLRELAGLDGAIIVDRDGTVESAGTYLIAPKKPPRELQGGLGARHVAAAGVTRKCKDAISVTISESSGVVRMFQGGTCLLKLEKTPLESYS